MSNRSVLSLLTLCASMILACSDAAGGSATSGSAVSSAAPKKASASASTKPTTTATVSAPATAAPAAPAPVLPDWAKDRGTEEVMGLHVPGKPSKKEIPPQWFETGLSAQYWYDGKDGSDLSKAMLFYFAQDGWKIEATKEIVGDPVYTVSKDGVKLDVSCAQQMSTKKGFIFIKKGF